METTRKKALISISVVKTVHIEKSFFCYLYRDTTTVIHYFTCTNCKLISIVFVLNLRSLEIYGRFCVCVLCMISECLRIRMSRVCFLNTFMSPSWNWRSQNVSGLQRQMLVWSSCKVILFTTPWIKLTLWLINMFFLVQGIPPQEEWNLDPNASYVYYCANETIHGMSVCLTSFALSLFHWHPVI